MTDLSNVKPETWEELAIERLRSLRGELARIQDTLWPWVQDIGEFLEKYDEWKKDREDGTDAERLARDAYGGEREDA